MHVYIYAAHSVTLAPQDDSQKGLDSSLNVADLNKMGKEKLVEVVQKYEMAYTFGKRAAMAMRTDLSAKLKSCMRGKKSTKAAANEDEALKKEEKRIEREKATNPAQKNTAGYIG